MEKQKFVCPHCGAQELVFAGLQWWPVWVIQKQGWSFCKTSDDGQYRAVRLFVCNACNNSFIEPSVFG